ncbi:MAG: arylmalonate decarboxylase [Alphaproteobacteria bacterium]|nr:arylmalonate decarboxylase [Alphaproteobacteria bacterium]
MAKDALGWRAKFAVVAPSTNTIVQPDMDDMRPPGVTNHYGRIHVPNMPIRDDETFVSLVKVIEGELYHAVDRCMTCEPDYLIMGMSALMFWGGRAASEERRQALERHCGVRVSAGSFALEAALNLYRVKRIAVVSPYQPISDKNVTQFFQDCGFDVVKFLGLRCTSPTNIAEVQEDALRRHLISLNDDKVEAIVQVGTNLSMVRLAVEAERWFGKPVMAINTATYWHALRAHGIADKVHGFGPLLENH